MTIRAFKQLVVAMEQVAARGEDTNWHKDQIIRFFEDPSTPHRLQLRAAGWVTHRIISKRRLRAAEEAEQDGIRALLRYCEALPRGRG